MKIPGFRKITKGVLIAPYRVLQGVGDTLNEMVNADKGGKKP